MFEVAVETTFAAGHALRGYRGKCENVHGHNYKIRVTLRGAQLDDIGLLYDFKDLKQALRGISESLDHQFLNDLEPFREVNPSAENLAKYFYDCLRQRLNGIGAQGTAARGAGVQGMSVPAGATLPAADATTAAASGSRFEVLAVTVFETDTTTATYYE